jgi:hypothetical protein
MKPEVHTVIVVTCSLTRFTEFCAEARVLFGRLRACDRKESNPGRLQAACTLKNDVLELIYQTII